jgi:hypothetical protein
LLQTWSKYPGITFDRCSCEHMLTTAEMPKGHPLAPFAYLRYNLPHFTQG